MNRRVVKITLYRSDDSISQDCAVGKPVDHTLPNWVSLFVLEVCLAFDVLQESFHRLNGVLGRREL